MPLRRSALCAALVASLALPLTGAADAVDHEHRVRALGPRAVLGLDAKSAKPPVAVGTERIVGADGLIYESAPEVVGGLHGDLFLGLEFDYYCALGAQFDKGLRRLAKLAKVIRNSGRTVVYTVAPGKTIVVNRSVNRAALPHGSCDQFGMDEQRKAIDTIRDSLYLPLRKSLARDKRQTYWKTDPHWTTVGGSVYAQQLAERLSPRLGRRQSYLPVEETEVGALNALLDILTPETAQGADPASRVTVTTAPGSTAWDGMPAVVFDHSWNSSPSRRTWRGHTLLIGDSFTQFALKNLRPVFRHGRFLWTGHVDPAVMVDAITQANTVAIEVYQGGVFNSIIGTTAFRKWVAAALRAASDG